MNELPSVSDSDSRSADEVESPPRAPRWVKVFGAVAAVLVVVIVGIHVAGGGLGAHMHTPR